MKRISIWLIAIIALASCGRPEFNTNNDLAREDLKGPVQSFYKITVYYGLPDKNPRECNHIADFFKYYNQAGNLTSVHHISDDTEDIYEYSESGLLQRIQDVDHYPGDEVTSVLEYKYDDAGRLLAVDEIRYRDDGSAKVSHGIKNYTYEEHASGALIRREYDDNFEPRLLKIDITNAHKDTELELYDQYEAEDCDIDIYDTDGNLRLSILESYNEMSGRRYIYDSYGKVQNVETLYNRYNVSRWEINVNDKGDITGTTLYYSSNNKFDEFSRTSIKYKYDKYGNWTSKKIKIKDTYGTHYTYYKRGFTYYE